MSNSAFETIKREYQEIPVGSKTDLGLKMILSQSIEGDGEPITIKEYVEGLAASEGLSEMRFDNIQIIAAHGQLSDRGMGIWSVGLGVSETSNELVKLFNISRNIRKMKSIQLVLLIPFLETMLIYCRNRVAQATDEQEILMRRSAERIWHGFMHEDGMEPINWKSDKKGLV